MQKTDMSSNTTPTIVKVGNIRYLVSNMNGKEYVLPDVSGDEKTLFTNGNDNTELVEGSQTLEYIKYVKEQSEQLQGDDMPTGGVSYIYDEDKGSSFALYFIIIFCSMIILTIGAYRFAIRFRKNIKS